MDSKYFKTETYVTCKICPRRCKLREGQIGKCHVRQNVGGQLKLLSYGKVAAMASDPIEKKPFYHFLPTTKAFTVGSVGCNAQCKFCQNWHFSHGKDAISKVLEKVSVTDPEDLVNHALNSGAKSVGFSFNEPTTWFEYVVDVANIAKTRDLKTFCVTNGFMERAVAEDLAGVIDAFNVSFKAFDYDTYADCTNTDFGLVKRNAQYFKERGKHVEITALIIPGITDNQANIRRFIQWVIDELGENTPVHFAKFHPDYKMRGVKETPLSTLSWCYSAAWEMGLNYPYICGVPYNVDYRRVFDQSGINTCCPNCGAMIIDRRTLPAIVGLSEDGRCEQCGMEIPIIR